MRRCGVKIPLCMVLIGFLACAPAEFLEFGFIDKLEECVETVTYSQNADTPNIGLLAVNCPSTTTPTATVSDDFNGDGIADVLAGAHLEDTGGSNAGAAYIFYGATNLSAQIDASAANVKLIGEDANDQLGRSVSGAGDINNDGIADVLVGAFGDDDGGADAGAAYIFYGATNLSAQIDASAANVKLIGEDAGDSFGVSVSGAGDVNNNGIADVLVGARYDDDGGLNAGAAYIFYGATNLAAQIDASNANVKLIGEDAADRFGISVSGAGDVNNNGIADVLVGADSDDDGGLNAGAAYIFYGSATLSSPIDASAANVKLNGVNAGAGFGTSVSAAGDVNNNGIADVIVGEIGGGAGDAYIFYGSTNLASSINASNANVNLNGVAENDELGGSVSGAGDVNNDGIADVIVGDRYEDTGGGNAGAAYIFYGATNLAAQIDASAANVKLIGEDAGDHLGNGVSKVGDVNNDGIVDVIVGAPNDDDGGSNAGAAYIFYGSATLSSPIDASAANVKLIGETAGDFFRGARK